jgi:hypothetical protein
VRTGGFTTAGSVLISPCLTAVAIAGCTSSRPSAQPSPAVIRVHVRLVYSHPAGPTMTSYDGPMRDEQVQAATEDGAGATGTTGADGIAVLHVPAGTYAVRANDPCGGPSTISPTPGATTDVSLTCVAP